MLQPALLDGNHGELKKLLAHFSTLKKDFEQQALTVDIIRQIFEQLLWIINCFVFNIIVERNSQYCEMSTAFEMKLAISEVEQWISTQFSTQEAEEMRMQLNHVNQACTLLISTPVVEEKEMREENLPDLNDAQLLNILTTLFKSDKSLLTPPIESLLSELKESHLTSDALLNPEKIVAFDV